MTDLWIDLLACLKLDVGGSETRFMARNQHLEFHRVFGGSTVGAVRSGRLRGVPRQDREVTARSLPA